MAGYHRKVIRICGEDSPNVRLALAERALGLEPSRRVMTPGVVTLDDYEGWLATWDEVRVCVGVHAQFWQGADALLYPPDWLTLAHLAADRLVERKRIAEAVGVDPGQGVANTAMTAVDRLGIVEQRSKKTPDTTEIVSDVIAFGQKHSVPSDRWMFDAGGGGHQIVDRLRQLGHHPRMVGFGEGLVPDPRRRPYQLNERLDNRKERYVYVNKRAEMFGILSEIMDPASRGHEVHGFAVSEYGFAIPSGLRLLREQMAKLPRKTDGEGRMWMIPKHDSGKATVANSKVETMVKLIGYSPDELDSLVLAVHAMVKHPRRAGTGVF